MNFRFTTPSCPACDERPDGVVVQLQALDVLYAGPGGTYHYAASVDVWWHSQVTLPANDEATLRLACPSGHHWDTTFTEVADDLLHAGTPAHPEPPQ